MRPRSFRVSTTNSQPAAGQRCGGGRDRGLAQGARPTWPRQRSADHRLPPRATARGVAVGRDDLAGAHPPGLHRPRAHKRPKSSLVRFEADQPNERWQLDITHWALADGTEVEILNQIDDHSRLAVGSDARVTFKAPDVVTCFRKAVVAHDVPAQMLSDNGAVFTGIPRGGGRGALELELMALGVSFRHSRPYHRQTCGKVERFHQTLKRWLARQPRVETLRGLQGQLDAFRSYYNDSRPHRALGRRTPADAFAARPKAVPLGSPIQDGHFRVRRDRVHAGGSVTLRHNSKLHHIAVGRRHAGERVLVLVHDLEIRVLSETGDLLRDLTIDPSRDYQRQPKP